MNNVVPSQLKSSNASTSISNSALQTNFPEDCLPLLGKSIHEQNAQEYWDAIVALFEPRTSAGKLAVIQPKGKIIHKPTKSDKRPLGTFEARYYTVFGEHIYSFKFDRDMRLCEPLEKIATALKCPAALLEIFLKKKKFVLPSDQA